MKQASLIARCLIESAPAGYIDFASNDRLDTGIICLLVEVDDTVHCAVIGDGNGDHVVGSSPVQKRPYTDGPIEEAVLCVDVEVNKV